MTGGRIFEIQHFALYDGPGIRTVVYLKGCPLRCIWCHNPEGISGAPEPMFDSSLCLHCGNCVSTCEKGCHSIANGRHLFDLSSCARCARCTAVCPVHAVRIAGTEVTAEDIMRELRKDLPYYHGQGGLTLSGGEPLYQPEFAYETLRAARAEGIGTCVETSGFCAPQVLRRVSSVTDLFLYDIKAIDPVLHRQCTGADNDRILSNLRLLDALDAKVVLRCPMIEGVNDGDGDLLAIARLADGLACVESVELEPYHPLGLAKYQSLGRTAAYENAAFYPRDRLASRLALVRANTGKPVKQS